MPRLQALVPIALLLFLAAAPGTTGAGVAVGSDVGASAASSLGYIGPTLDLSSVDLDGDGLIDGVTYSLPVILNVSGHWVVVADPWYQGNPVGHAGFEGNLSAQYNIVNVTIPAWPLRLLHVNSSYPVQLSLYLPTQTYAWSRWDSLPLTNWTSLDYLAEFRGSWSDVGTDADSNGLFDYLDVYARLEIGTPGTFTVYASLYPLAGGNRIADWGRDLTGASGNYTIRIRFGGDFIRLSVADGPYRVEAELRAWRAGESSPSEFAGNTTYVTAAYGAMQFFHQPIALAGALTASAVDADGNGRYDWIRIRVPVDVSLGRNYTFYGTLWSPMGDNPPAVNVIQRLAAGPAVVAVDFDTFPLYVSSSSGPYYVEIWIVEEDGAYVIKTSLTTGTFPSEQFDNPYGLILAGAGLHPLDSDGDGTYDMLYVNATIRAKANVTFLFQVWMEAGPADPLRLDRTVEVKGGPGDLPVSIRYTPAEVRDAKLSYGNRFVVQISVLAAPKCLDAVPIPNSLNWTQFFGEVVPPKSPYDITIPVLTLAAVGAGGVAAVLLWRKRRAPRLPP